MDEKIAMGDGRFDQDKLVKAIEQHAREALLLDMEALAKQSGSIINAVMLGAIAGCGRLPMTAEAIRGRDPRRRQGGREQSARLPRRARGRARQASAGQRRPIRRKRAAQRRAAARARGRLFAAAALAQATAIEGVRRLIAYQGVRYARLYLDRLRR